MKDRQKQYNKFTDEEKREFKEFAMLFEFIQKSVLVLFDDLKTNRDQRKILIDFLWYCYFSFLSPVKQILVTNRILLKEKPKNEWQHFSENKFILWEKTRKVINKWNKLKRKIAKKDEYEEEYIKYLIPHLKEEFNIVLGFDMDKYIKKDNK